MSHRITAARCSAGLLALLVAGTAVAQDRPAPLRVCADPANMPLSNKQGEGFQNKVAEVLAKEMGTTLEYFWYPYYGRGLVRSTINAERCDVLMDVPADFEMALTTTPVFKSTFVLAYRNDRKYTIASLDDDLLKTINIGVFQSSPAREALRMHGVMENTTVQYILFDAAAAPEDQPAKQIENVIAGKIDAAESWGPIAGYYAKQKNAPITVLPINRMSDNIPLEFAVSLGVRRSDKELQQKLNAALVSGKERIRAILDSYGVPLVTCAECVVSGDVPAHGPYPDRAAEVAEINRDKPVSSPEALAAVKKNVAAGADPTQALAEAVIGNDPERVRWLLANKADPNKTVDADYNALQWAVREGRVAVAQVLLDNGADPNKADASNWSPIMFAVWRDNPAMVKLLASKGAKLDAFGAQGWNALSVAIAYAGLDQVKQLVELGADVNAANPVGYTPLMFATAKGADGVPEYLIEKGARVGAANQAGITSLMMAAAENNAALTRLLLKAGADPAARDGQRRTAFDIATIQGHKDITALLSKPR